MNLATSDLIIFTDRGMYVPQADVYIDPWRSVERALITHAHSDHARWGMQHYLAHQQSIPILKSRLGINNYQSVAYGETTTINGVKFTFYPAGHVLGSSQIKVEYKGNIWVVSGDYKLVNDGICTPFEPVKCHAFITESTFGLPVFNWKSNEQLKLELNEIWRLTIQQNKSLVIFAYALGKAQRVLQLLDNSLGKVFVHGAVYNMNEACQESGVQLNEYLAVSNESKNHIWNGSAIIAPPSAAGSTWLKKFEPYITVNASGWMALRGARRRSAVDYGLVMSDHADWNDLNTAIKQTSAEKILVTHGYSAIFAKYLREQGYDAIDVNTEFKGELTYGTKEEEVS